jgi:hypothetical protein
MEVNHAPCTNGDSARGRIVGPRASDPDHLVSRRTRESLRLGTWALCSRQCGRRPYHTRRINRHPAPGCDHQWASHQACQAETRNESPADPPRAFSPRCPVYDAHRARQKQRMHGRSSNERGISVDSFQLFVDIFKHCMPCAILFECGTCNNVETQTEGQESSKTTENVVRERT